MDRRAFITRTLAAAGLIAASAGAAQALPALAPHDAIAPEGEVEKAWWYRRTYWRRPYYWRRRYWRRRYW